MRVIVWQVVVKQLAPAAAAAHEPVDIGIPLVIVPAQVRLLKVAIYVHESEKGGEWGVDIGKWCLCMQTLSDHLFPPLCCRPEDRIQVCFFFSPPPRKIVNEHQLSAERNHMDKTT